MSEQLICAKCGSIEKVILHHLSYNPEILQPLCQSCHTKKGVHDGIKRPRGFNSKIALKIKGMIRINLYSPQKKRVISGFSISKKAWAEWLVYVDKKAGIAKLNEVTQNVITEYMQNHPIEG